MKHAIRTFPKSDIDQALDLCRAAGWNQLHDDWARLIDHQPDGCFAAYCGEELVGTVTTTSYGQALGWIGMMLVHPEYRRRGIATDLMNRSLSFLRKGNVRCIKLDATPAGQPVYERLGFRTEWTFHRWQLDHPPTSSGPRFVNGSSAGDQAFPLDGQAFGVDRTAWLTRLAKGSICHMASDGFGMIRAGYLADYLGPVTAANRDAARQIIVELLEQARGKVFWDIPGPNHLSIEIARQLGFQPVRDLTRMWVGETLSPDLNLQYALCDPGTG